MHNPFGAWPFKVAIDKLVIECELHYGEKLIFIDQIKRQIAGGENRQPVHGLYFDLLSFILHLELPLFFGSADLNKTLLIVLLEPSLVE